MNSPSKIAISFLLTLLGHMNGSAHETWLETMVRYVESSYSTCLVDYALRQGDDVIITSWSCWLNLQQYSSLIMKRADGIFVKILPSRLALDLCVITQDLIGMTCSVKLPKKSRWRVGIDELKLSNMLARKWLPSESDERIDFDVLPVANRW